MDAAVAWDVAPSALVDTLLFFIIQQAVQLSHIFLRPLNT
jgi:hypothetical protein